MRPLRLYVRIALIVALVVVMLPSAGLAARDIGTVIAFTPGASVLRDGGTVELALRAGIRVSDTVRTDAGGRVKILFNDDSTVSLGPDTILDMREYADAGGKSAFSIHVPQGVVRTITGKIVDQNPGGFKISTPEATVGIRGTIVSLRTGGGVTTVFVENTLRQVYVNNIRVPSGNKITLPGDPPRPEPIQPEDRRQLGRDLAFLGGNGTAAAAPEPVPGGGRRPDAPALFAAGPGMIPPDTPLTDIALSTQTLGDSLRPLAGPLMGHVEGSFALMVASGNFAAFGFDVNLSNRMISGGYFNFTDSSGIGITGSLGNGTGTAYVSGGFDMTTAVGTLSQGPASFSGFAWVKNTGTMDLLTTPIGQSFDVTYGIEDVGTPAIVESGTSVNAGRRTR